MLFPSLSKLYVENIFSFLDLLLTYDYYKRRILKCKKVSLKSLFAIALVLSCGFMFAVIILPNAIGEDDEPVVSWTEDAENISKSQDVKYRFREWDRVCIC